MSSQLIRSPRVQMLLRKHWLTMQSATYFGRAKIGKREVVGFGSNGEYIYFDAPDVPMPAIRFREEDNEIAKLREKERGPWKDLSIEDKKKLYRFSFCRTYAEMQAPTGEWKSVTAGVLAIIASAFWIYVWLKKYVYAPMPESTSMEWRKKQRDWMIMWRVNPVEGISSKYDYENNRWKD